MVNHAKIQMYLKNARFMGIYSSNSCENLSKVTCYAVTLPKTSNSFEDENKKMLYVPGCFVILNILGIEAF